MDKFAGVGLLNAVLIAFITMLVIVATKTVLTKYPVNGLSEIVQAV